MEVKNVMEQIVFDCVERNIDMLQCCTCPKCKADIVACVLNKIPPRYVTTEKGELFARVEQVGGEMKTEIMVEIIRAAEVVKKSPNHHKVDN